MTPRSTALIPTRVLSPGLSLSGMKYSSMPISTVILSGTMLIVAEPVTSIIDCALAERHDTTINADAIADTKRLVIISYRLIGYSIILKFTQFFHYASQLSDFLLRQSTCRPRFTSLCAARERRCAWHRQGDLRQDRRRCG